MFLRNIFLVKLVWNYWTFVCKFQISVSSFKLFNYVIQHMVLVSLHPLAFRKMEFIFPLKHFLRRPWHWGLRANCLTVLFTPSFWVSVLREQYRMVTSNLKVLTKSGLCSNCSQKLDECSLACAEQRGLAIEIEALPILKKWYRCGRGKLPCFV